MLDAGSICHLLHILWKSQNYTYRHHVKFILSSNRLFTYSSAPVFMAALWIIMDIKVIIPRSVRKLCKQLHVENYIIKLWLCPISWLMRPFISSLGIWAMTVHLKLFLKWFGAPKTNCLLVNQKIQTNSSMCNLGTWTETGLHLLAPSIPSHASPTLASDLVSKKWMSNLI